MVKKSRNRFCLSYSQAEWDVNLGLIGHQVDNIVLDLLNNGVCYMLLSVKVLRYIRRLREFLLKMATVGCRNHANLGYLLVNSR